MPPLPKNHSLTGEEKTRYLHQLNDALTVLANSYTSSHDELSPALKTFGEKNDWNWSRLPSQPKTNQTIGELLNLVRREYQWFDCQDHEQDPAQNQGYFENIDVSAEAGLPWSFDFISLHRLRGEARSRLEKMPSYEDTALELRSLLTEDFVDMGEVPARVKEIHKTAMKRNFLEQLQSAALLGWESTGYSLPPQARKISSLGGEELWNISLIRYSPASSMFQLFTLDLWQDIREPQITMSDKGTPIVSPKLDAALKFGEDNAAWYIIQSIDEKFLSLHPVHVSRGLVGPFENKYLTKPDQIKTLPITAELLKGDQKAALLRFSRQYAFAPNHQEVEGRLQQVVYREDWREEAIVCSARYASRVASSVLGTQVKVIQW